MLPGALNAFGSLTDLIVAECASLRRASLAWALRSALAMLVPPL